MRDRKTAGTLLRGSVRHRAPTEAPAGAVSVVTDVGELWLPAGCQFVTPALQQTGTWEPEDGTAISRALRPGMTILDVGAHVGYFAILAARCVGPSGHVIAVEASPDNFRLLEANVVRCGLNNVEAIHAAAWHTTGEVELELCATNTGDHRVGMNDSGRRKVRVPALALDDRIGPDGTVDFVLLDTQGSEAAVLAGMRSCLVRCRPRLQVEFWPAGIREFGGDPNDVLASYRELGYEITALGRAVAEDLVSAAEATTGGFVTLLLTPREEERPGQLGCLPTLSVCIPTHDGRRARLQETINSVVGQVTPDIAGRVSVIVSDNASSDGTAEMVEQMVDDHHGLVTYHRNEVDLGAAANMMRVVEMADAEYVWLLGSDDQLESGALARAFELLEAHPGTPGVTVNKRNFDAAMTTELPDEPVTRPQALRVYRDPETALRECGLLHGMMSAQVIHRASWLCAAGDNPLPRTRFAPHIRVIGQVLMTNPGWIWCPDRLVRQRCDPATPREHGYASYRLMLAILAEVEGIWAGLLGRRSPTYRHLLDGWCRYVLDAPLIVHYKTEPGHRLRDDILMLAGFARHAWRSPYFRRRSLPLLLTPHPLVHHRTRPQAR